MEAAVAVRSILNTDSNMPTKAEKRLLRYGTVGEENSQLMVLDNIVSLFSNCRAFAFVVMIVV